MLSLTLLPLPSHLLLQPFPARAGKNVSGGDAVDRLCERAPSLEIKGDSCFMARRTKGARSKETMAKKTTSQPVNYTGAPACSLMQATNPFSSSVWRRCRVTPSFLSVTFHHHPDHLRPPTSLPPPTQGRSGREFLITSAPASHGTSAAYRTSEATSI